MMFRNTALNTDEQIVAEAPVAKANAKAKKPLTRKQEFARAKLWRVAEIALEDLAAVEKQKKLYHIEMDNWHVPANETDYNYSGKCEVCLAGSVIANSLGASHETMLRPANFSEQVNRRLCAINALRCGEVGTALHHDMMHGGTNARATAAGLHEDFIMRATPYEKDKRAFKRDMRKIIALLRKFDL